MRDNRIWTNPTSYGMVISFIDDRGLLERIYLNDAAVDELLGPDNRDVMDALSQRGVEPSVIIPKFSRMISEREKCRELCRGNSWDLFSLDPMQLSVQLLVHCNARCDFCYAGSAGRPRRGFMEPRTVRALKDYAAEYGVKLGMTGGEPLLHPDIIDMLSYRGDEVYDTLITNLTPDIDTRAIAGTGVDLIQVSLHGAGEVHDRILGIPGAYVKALDRMGLLAENINIATNTVVTPGNMNRIHALLRDLADFQDRSGARLAYVRFAPVMPSGTGKGRYQAAEAFFSDARAILEAIEGEWGSELELELPLLHPNPYEYRNVNGKTTCPAGATVAVVRLDGRLSPCNQFVETDITADEPFDGNNFRQLWLEDPLLSSMRRARDIPPGGDFCGGCAYLGSMQGKGP